MGTNFYATAHKCPTCGRGDDHIHLGKSSIGWPFTLQWNGGTYYKNWEEMKAWLADKVIEDEYGKEVTKEDFIEWVENRKATPVPEEYADDSDGGRLHTVDGYRFYDADFS